MDLCVYDCWMSVQHVEKAALTWLWFTETTKQDIYFSFSVTAFCKFCNVYAISAVFCFNIFPVALWLSFCHLLFVRYQLSKNSQYTIKVRNGLEMQGSFFTELYSVSVCKAGLEQDNMMQLSICHSHYKDLIQQAIYWISLGNDCEILFNSVIASYQNQMYTGSLESCTVLLHLPLRASSLVKYQQFIYLFIFWCGGALSKRQPLFSMGLFDW